MCFCTNTVNVNGYRILMHVVWDAQIDVVNNFRDTNNNNNLVVENAMTIKQNSYNYVYVLCIHTDKLLQLG